MRLSLGLVMLVPQGQGAGISANSEMVLSQHALPAVAHVTQILQSCLQYN